MFQDDIIFKKTIPEIEFVPVSCRISDLINFTNFCLGYISRLNCPFKLKTDILLNINFKEEYNI